MTHVCPTPALLQVCLKLCGAAQIVCVGKSLGAAVGIHLTAKRKDKFAAAVFENTFTSITDVAPKVGRQQHLIIGCSYAAAFLASFQVIAWEPHSLPVMRSVDSCLKVLQL